MRPAQCIAQEGHNLEVTRRAVRSVLYIIKRSFLTGTMVLRFAAKLNSTILSVQILLKEYLYTFGSSLVSDWRGCWINLVVAIFLSTSLHAASSAIANNSLTEMTTHWSKHCSTQKRRSLATPLRLLTLLPYRNSSEFLGQDPSWDYGRDILPVLDLAVEQINNRSDFLPCHKLELFHREAGCEITTRTLLGLTSSLFPGANGRSVIGVIGPVCSLSSTQASAITNRPQTEVVLLHNSGSSLLADRTKFPYSLGILGSSQSFVNLSLVLMMKGGWLNIAILYDSVRLYYHSMMKQFIASVKKKVHIRYLSTITSTFYPLDEVRSSRTRIVFVFTPLKHSSRIMCLAHYMKLLYPRYQWIFMTERLSNFKDTVFTYQGRDYNCSHKVLVDSLEGSFLMNYQLSSMTSPKDTKLPQNVSFEEFLKLYKQRVDEYNVNRSEDTISPTHWAYSMYDAVWAWGIVLNILTANHNGSRLAFGYGNNISAKMTLEQFYSINFQGMSGNITFNSNSGFVDRLVNLYQVVNGTEKHVACSNGVTLKDFKTIPDVMRAVGLPHIGIVGFFLGTHCVELLAVVLLHMFTFQYRNTKFVKASSPKLIQPALLGTYLLILAMTLNTFFYVKELSSVTGGIICQAVWTWLLPISFTLMMGIITVRVWRLYRIFTHYLNPGKFISNPALFAILLILVLLDILIATVWTVVDPMRFEFIEYTVKNGTTVDLLEDQSCTSNYTPLWIGVVFTYKLSLLLAMILLSVLTHRIPNQAFSTALLRVFSYVFSAVFVIGFSLYYLLFFFDRHSNIDFLILSILLTILLLVFIIFVVIPPLQPVIKHKLKSFY